MFQSTHSRGVRLRVLVRAYSIQPFQSTHPRGVRQIFKKLKKRLDKVSIHAPAWGATSMALFLHINILVSIHAPAWGATGMFPIVFCGMIGVQSTHPRGVRHAAYPHARAATPCFNPRTRVGCDLRRPGHEPGQSGCFNPRTRVGCDSPAPVRAPRACCFNPRTRVGCDYLSPYSPTA